MICYFGRFLCFAGLVESFGSDVCPVRPDYGPTLVRFEKLR